MNSIYEVFDGFFSGLLSSGPNEDQEKQIFESQMKKNKEKEEKNNLLCKNGLITMLKQPKSAIVFLQRHIHN
jgi:hypothetical protein